MKKPRLKAGPTSHISAVIMGSINGRAVRSAVAAGANGFELRADTLKGVNKERIVEAVRRLRGYKVLKNLPIILTIRSRKEGGESDLSEKERAELFALLNPFTDIIDIELSSRTILDPVIKGARETGSQVIISYHNFTTTPKPARLNEIIARARSKGADIVKIATMTKKPADLQVLTRLLLENKNLIIVAMGQYGAGSRVFFPMLGSLTTYGSITRSSAPGQMPVGTIKEQFKLYGY